MKQYSLFIICLNILFNQPIGGLLKEEQTCHSESCTKDSVRLGLSVFSNSTINPCDDFDGFIRSAWNQNRPEPVASGVIETFVSRLVNLLEEKDSDRDARIVKVTKNFFRKCLQPENNLETWTEMSDYLKTLGSSPFLSGTSWEPERFSLQSVFEREPKLALKVFFNRELKMCSDPKNPSHKLVCFRDFGYEIFGLHNYKKFLDEIFDIEELRQMEAKLRINETAERLNDLDWRRVSHSKIQSCG